MPNSVTLSPGIAIINQYNQGVKPDDKFVLYIPEPRVDLDNIEEGLQDLAREKQFHFTGLGQYEKDLDSNNYFQNSNDKCIFYQRGSVFGLNNWRPLINTPLQEAVEKFYEQIPNEQEKIKISSFSRGNFAALEFVN